MKKRVSYTTLRKFKTYGGHLEYPYVKVSFHVGNFVYIDFEAVKIAGKLRVFIGNYQEIFDLNHWKMLTDAFNLITTKEVMEVVKPIFDEEFTAEDAPVRGQGFMEIDIKPLVIIKSPKNEE